MQVAPFNAIFWRSSQTLTSSRPSSSPCGIMSQSPHLDRVPHDRDPFLLLILERWQSAISICCVRKFVVWLLIFFLTIFSFPFFVFFSYIYVFPLSCVFRIPHGSPLRIINADMFATPSIAFELPSYAARLAHQFAEAPSPPPLCTQPFNKLVLDFLDVEAEQSDNNDRDDSPSRWLGLVGLESRAPMPCFLYEFFCFIYICPFQIPRFACISSRVVDSIWWRQP